MSTLILLIVGAAWAAVLLPPLLRSRFESFTTSSVSDFRRTLHTLQRTQTRLGGQSSMRAMARPLAPDMHARRPRQMPAPMFNDVQFDDPRFADRRPAARAQRPAPRAVREFHLVEDEFDQAYVPRRSARARVSSRELVRRRRQKTLNWLGGVTATSLFLALTTGNGLMLWVFALSAIALVVFCYLLVQIRNAEQMRRYYGRAHQRRAA